MRRHNVKFCYDVVTVDVLDERIRAQECWLCPLTFLPGQRVAKMNDRYSSVACYLHLECMAQLVANDPEAIENRFAEMKERIVLDLAAETIMGAIGGEGFQVAESRSRRTWVTQVGTCGGCNEFVWSDQGYFFTDAQRTYQPPDALFHDGCTALEPSKDCSPHPRSAAPLA